MKITLEACGQYFAKGNHPASDAWAALSPSERQAAFAYAQRMLERIKGEALEEPEAETNYDVREDLALFEQALWSGQHNPARRNAEKTGQAYDLTKPDGSPAQTESMEDIAPEAMRWLGWNSSAIMRGG